MEVGRRTVMEAAILRHAGDAGGLTPCGRLFLQTLDRLINGAVERADALAPIESSDEAKP